MYKLQIAAVAFLFCAAVSLLAAEAPLAKSVPSLESFAARENRFWTVFQKKDVHGFRKMVTDDYLNIDYGGEVATASEFAAAFADFNVTDFKLSDFRLIQPTPATAVLVYHARLHFTYKGTPGGGEVIASTVWVKRQGRWLASHYQETLIHQQ